MSKKNKINRPTSMAASPTTRAEFKPDYTYVKRDLTRIGILAGSFFVVLIVLSFFIK